MRLFKKRKQISQYNRLKDKIISHIGSLDFGYGYGDVSYYIETAIDHINNKEYDKAIDEINGIIMEAELNSFNNVSNFPSIKPCDDIIELINQLQAI